MQSAVLLLCAVLAGLQPSAGLHNRFVYQPGFIGAGNDVLPPLNCTPQHALALCDGLPRCRAITYHGGNQSTGPARVYFKDVAAAAGDASWSTFAKHADPTPPAVTVSVSPDLVLSLRQGSFTVQALNHTGASPPYSFVRPLDAGSTLPLCAHLGDLSLRLGSPGGWESFDSTYLGEAVPLPHQPPVLAAHDISRIIAGSNLNRSFPLRVVRSYEADGKALVIRFKLTNTASQPVVVGGLGFAMPDSPGAGPTSPAGIETTVWSDPHIGGQHGFAEFVRVVDDEQTLLATPDPSAPAGLEAWRPMLEDLADGSSWEWTVHSQAWAEEWAKTRQAPFLNMSASTHGDPDMFPQARTPWPSTAGHEGVPVLPEASFPFNPPTNLTLEPGRSKEYAVRFQLASGGPRTRDALLAELGEPVIHGVPGFVLSETMQSSQLIVKPPRNSTVVAAAAVTAGAGNGTIAISGRRALANGFVVFGLRCAGVGRVRVTVSYSDGSSSAVHYYVLPGFERQVASLGQFYSNVAWLPRDYPDPFGRSASVMPYDRETRSRVLNDARAYDVCGWLLEC